MKTLTDLPEMARANADMAIDQRHAYDDSIAAHAKNVVDTLNEWGIERGHGYYNYALSIYYGHVAHLLDAASGFMAIRTKRAQVKP